MSETWADIPGQRGRYQVSDLGRVRSLARVVPGGNGQHRPVAARILKASPTGKGYLGVTIRTDGVKKTCAVHVLVAQEFVPNPHGKPQVNHEDGIKANCAASNLTWATNAENQKHGAEHGLMPKKLANSNGKLSEDDVRRIKLHLKTGAPTSALALNFGVDLIRRIRAGTRHA